MTRLTTRLGFTLACLLWLGGCHYLKSVDIPLTAETYHHEPGNKQLIILLHGLGGSAGNFQKYGVVTQLRDCAPDANILGANSHFGYYRERVIIERLRQDLIEPAFAEGVTEVWFLGVSMGGIGALVYREAYPQEVGGAILMAPYIGEKDKLMAYAEDPQNFRETSSSDLLFLWDSLTASNPPNESITLAFGEQDGSNWQHNWLAQMLPKSQVISMPGGHKWKIWKDLWPQAIERSGLCQS